ncbi:insulinase family protein [Candidatus Similichlamydia laticola]|uniref:Protease III n=1 Tax=Candidatus Similichlamydia laticola TaxID=2170265 RepID=A0A369KCV6_9BACT|nr:insulinase family protein [Candidatus Similichlamydia laticola]RDB31290.1 Protease III precursor [Candidatus Similichlamydia laticola]
MRFVHMCCCFCPIFFLWGNITPSEGSCFGPSVHTEISVQEASSSNILKRKESRIRLKNGICLVLISDPLADRCHLTLTVSSGYASPRCDTFGLAHMLTHTVFLDTNVTQQPLLKLLRDKQVELDASVEQDYTSYCLSSPLSHFEESLDLFSTALLQPGIRAEELKLAKQEIALEHAERLNDDRFRIQWTREEVYSPEHPLHQASLGKETDLSRVTAEILRNWHRRNYVGNRMFLVVNAPLAIEQMQPLLISCFERFPSPHQEDLFVEGTTYTSLPSLYRGQEPSLLYVCTQKERVLELEWALGPSPGHNKSHQWTPEEILGKLLMHKAKGGLVSILRQCGFLEDIEYDFIQRSPHSELPQQFRVRAFLTKKGTKEWSMVLSEILLGLEIIAEKANLEIFSKEALEAHKIRHFLREHPEGRQICLETAQDILIRGLASLSEQTLPSVPDLAGKTFPAYAQTLTKQSPFLVTLACPVDEWHRAHDGLSEKEAWLHVHSQKRNNQFQWLFRSLPELPKASLAQKLLMPPKNVLLSPEQSTHAISPHVTLEPTDLSKGLGQFYYCSDFIWARPVGHWQILLSLPDPSSSPGSASGAELSQLCVGLLEEATRSVIYLAGEAGIRIQYRLISPKTLELSVSGPCDQTGTLVESILQGLSRLSISEETFNLAKKRRIKNLTERCFFAPQQLALLEMEATLFDGFSLEQRIDDLNELSFHQAMHFIDQIKQFSFAKGCYFGSHGLEEIESWWGKISSINFFEPSRAQYFETAHKQEVTPKEEQILYSLEPGSACAVALHLGNYSVKSFVKKLVLAKMLESFLEQKNLEGIPVHFSVHPMMTDHRLYFAFTAALEDIPLSNDMILSLLDACADTLLRISTESQLLFEENKRKTLHDLRQPIRTAQSAINLLSQRLFLDKKGSDWPPSLLEEAMSITHQDMLQFIKEHLLKETRRAFFIRVQGIPSDQKHAVLEEGRTNWCQFNLLKHSMK